MKDKSNVNMHDYSFKSFSTYEYSFTIFIVTIFLLG